MTWWWWWFVVRENALVFFTLKLLVCRHWVHNCKHFMIPCLGVKKMESKSYAICEVEFEEGTQYSILCSSWLIRPAKNDGTAQAYCLWPCKKELSSVLAKYRCVPDEDFWIRYKCRVIIEYSQCIIHSSRTGFVDYRFLLWFQTNMKPPRSY